LISSRIEFSLKYHTEVRNIERAKKIGLGECGVGEKGERR
jgi:hypothetical protein